MDFETVGLTELRMNAKSAIVAINQLAKRLEQADIKIAQHEDTIGNMQQLINEQIGKTTLLTAKLYEAGVR